MTKVPTREALQRADRLASLPAHPAWETLVEEVARKVERSQRSLNARIYAPGATAEAVPEGEIRYWAGFFAGMEYLLNMPAGAQSTLDEFSDQPGE